MYVEHERVLESLAIGRDPLIPCDGLAFFEDVHDVSIKPTLGGRSRKFPEWDLALRIWSLTNVKMEMRRGVARSPSESSQNILEFERDESQRGELYTDCSIH
jgi:hypothetical protein